MIMKTFMHDLSTTAIYVIIVKQNSFVKNKSTTNSLIRLHLQFDIIYTDFSRAFD